MVPETRLPRTRSATALAAAQHAHVPPHPPPVSGIPAPDKSAKGHLRRQSGIARPRISVMSKARAGGNLAQEKEDAPPTSIAPAPARLQHPVTSPIAQTSQIPQRSAIPRPVTMSSIASLLRDADKADRPDKADKADKVKAAEKENGGKAVPPGSTAGSTTGSCIENTSEERALRSTRSFTSIQRPRTTSIKSGTENGSMTSTDASKEVVVDRLDGGKAKGKDKDAKSDQSEKDKLAAKRVPLSERLTKEFPASPGLMSPPSTSTQRVLKRRPQSISGTASLFSSVSKNSLPSLTRVPPRMKLVQDAEVEFDLDSPSPLPGSLAASKNGRKSAPGTPSSISSTPNSSLSRATGVAAATATARDCADIAATASPRPNPEGFIPPPQYRAPTKTVITTPVPELPAQADQNSSPLASRFGSAPASPIRGEGMTGVKRPSFGRPAIPDTPAIRHLIARERELSRVTDMSDILEMDISLASNASFGTLTPPASRLMQSTAPPPPQPSSAPNRFGFEREKPKTFEYPHASNSELHAALARLQSERGDLEARVASLTAEESRLKTLADRAMGDREDARAAQEEAEARRDGAMWDALVQSLDEAIEEENALRGTIACLRAVVQAM